jgi:hypothetical protein
MNSEMKQPCLTMPTYWKGRYYGSNPFSLRILVLGESHNDDTAATDRDTTIRVVQARIDNLLYGPFFKVVESILLGRPAAVFEVQKIWENVAFANYAPYVVIRPGAVKAEHFIGARERLAEMVRELEPNLICFFSKKAWHNRPRPAEHLREVSVWKEAFDADPVEIDEDHVIYPFGQHQALAVRFNHPRNLGMAASNWHQRFAAAAIKATKIKYGAVHECLNWLANPIDVQENG